MRVHGDWPIATWTRFPRIGHGAAHLDEQSLDGVLDGLDLALELPVLVRGDASSDDRAGNAASPAESSLRRYKDVWHVLVLAEQRQVENNLDGLDVCSHDDELADTSVERLGGLVSSLLELLVVGGLLHEVQDLVREGSVGQREGLGVCSARHLD